MKITVNKLVLFGLTLNCLSFYNITLFNTYSTICYYLNLMLVFLIIFSHIVGSKKNMIGTKIIYIMLFCFYLLMSIILSGGGVGSVLTMIYSMMVYVVYSVINFSKKDMKYLFFIFLFMSIYIFIKSFGYFEIFISDKYGYINTNTMGMVAFFSLIYNMIFYKYLYKKYTHIFYFLQIVMCFISLVNYECRGSLISMIFFVACFLFVKKNIWYKKKFVLLFFIIIVSIGTIFPFIYSNMYLNHVYFEIPFLHKGLYTGREVIWINTISIFKNSSVKWLTGIGSNAIVWTNDMNLHNNYFAVITNFGFLGYAFYYGFIFFQINKGLKAIDSIHIDLLIGLFSILILSYVEIVTLWETMFLINILIIGLYSNPSLSLIFQGKEG